MKQKRQHEEVISSGKSQLSMLPFAEFKSQSENATQSACASAHMKTRVMQRQNRVSREIWGANKLTAELLGKDLDDMEGAPAADPRQDPMPSRAAPEKLLRKRQARPPAEATRPKV